MDAFENIAAKYLEEKGYWVRQCVRVNISKEEKRNIGTHSMPAPILDMVALNVAENKLLLVEVKSFLNSTGVRYDGVVGKNEKDASRYKLFTKDNYREIIVNRIREDYLNRGLINSRTKIICALLAGNIRSTKRDDDEPKIREHFQKKGWELFSPRNIKATIGELSGTEWEDNVVTMTAKLTKEAIVNGTSNDS